MLRLLCQIDSGLVGIVGYGATLQQSLDLMIYVRFLALYHIELGFIRIRGEKKMVEG